MPRFPKNITHDLILYAKKLEVKANFWDPRAKSAFEFARQMTSPKLKKKNPSFECNLVYLDSEELPSLTAQYLDGSKWVTQTVDFSVGDLRSQFYERASRIEELSEGVENSAAATATGGKKGDSSAKAGGKK